MSGPQLSSAGLDPRRKRLLFRAWHRGMRETDILLGRFADREIVGLSDSELDDLETLVEAPDGELLKWITGELAVPEEFDTLLFARLKAAGAAVEKTNHP